MKSIIYSGAQDVRVEEKSLPEIAPGEVLIKVAYVGVCGSDMNIYQGVHPRAKAPLVMGHEFSGTIVAGHPTLPEGTPVTVYPLLSCGHCEPCRNGYAHVCNTLKLIGIDCDGAMAQYVKPKTSNGANFPLINGWNTRWSKVSPPSSTKTPKKRAWPANARLM